MRFPVPDSRLAQCSDDGAWTPGPTHMYSRASASRFGILRDVCVCDEKSLPWDFRAAQGESKRLNYETLEEANRDRQ